MRKLLSSRVLLICVVAVICVVLVGQNLGIAGSQAPSETTDPTVAATARPHVDWALAGLILGGALITLLRPRRRKVAEVTQR